MSHYDGAHPHTRGNVPANCQPPVFAHFSDIAWARILITRSPWQGQRSNQGHAIMLHTYPLNQCPCQVSTSYRL